MKKILVIALLASIFCSLPVTGAYASSLGTGIEVIASEVKMIKTAVRGEKLVFSDGDFKSALALTDFASITVTTLPDKDNGTLLNAGRAVKEGQTIKRKNIGSLIFVPRSSEVSRASFSFRVNGAGAQTVAECEIKFIEKLNTAPYLREDGVVSTSVFTQSGISLYGQLAGEDREGDALEFIIVSFPKQGAVRITDKATGKYEYTPLGSYTGYDSFTYVIRDEYGNYSQPCAVKVRVTERLSDTVLTDMVGRREYGAAVAMCAIGVMSPESFGGASYFKPDERVTRAEFVAMALKAYGINPNGQGECFFDDAKDIPTALKEYVSYAAKSGIVDGDFGADGLIFRPSDSITLQDAAVILSRLLGVGEGEEKIYGEGGSIASWAVPSVYALMTLGILDANEEIDGTNVLTRAEVAEYLYRMVNVK